METSNSKVGVADSSATISDFSKTETDSETQAINNVDSAPFSVNQQVIAIHQNLNYSAKVIGVQLQGNEYRFLVHYHGWKSSWDEWLGTDQLLEYSDENLHKHRLTRKKRKSEKSRGQPACSSSSDIKPKNNIVAGGKKRSIDSVTKDKDDIPMEKLVRIQIPTTLKKQLLDDCEFVNDMGKLVKLPRIPNVNEIFAKYLEYKEQKDGELDDSVEQFVRLFQSYFDKALPAMLLYKSERRQYEQATSNGMCPSSVYGAEHLLRLFVKFPELLSDARNDATIEEDEQTDLLTKLVDLLKFLWKNQNGFFLSTYHVAEDIQMSTTNKQED